MMRLFLVVCIIIFSQEQAASQNRLFNFVDDILAYQEQIKIVGDSTENKQLSGFDGNEYMNLFPLVRIGNLKCTYDYDSLGGEPYLSVDDKPASQCVAPLEDTPESYCQYLYFCEFGDQFALLGHALYKEKSIIRSTYRLKNIISLDEAIDTIQFSSDNMKNYILRTLPVEYKFDKECLKNVIDMGVFPVVEMKDKNCIITIYEERYDEIRRVSYAISRKPPYAIVATEEAPLVEISRRIIL